jgi:hypothetical protein
MKPEGYKIAIKGNGVVAEVEPTDFETLRKVIGLELL